MEACLWFAPRTRCLRSVQREGEEMARATRRQGGGQQRQRRSSRVRTAQLDLLYLSTSCLWWQAVVGRIGVKSSHALRSHSRRTWRHRESARNVHNTAIRRALSPSPSYGGVTAGVTAAPEAWHRLGTTPRAGTPGRPLTGGETAESLHMPRDAMPVHLSSFRLLAMASPQPDARRKLLI